MLSFFTISPLGAQGTQSHIRRCKSLNYSIAPTVVARAFRCRLLQSCCLSPESGGLPFSGPGPNTNLQRFLMITKWHLGDEDFVSAPRIAEDTQGNHCPTVHCWFIGFVSNRRYIWLPGKWERLFAEWFAVASFSCRWLPIRAGFFGGIANLFESISLRREFKLQSNCTRYVYVTRNGQSGVIWMKFNPIDRNTYHYYLPRICAFHSLSSKPT